MARLPSGAAIASDALKYQGVAYTWGGRADHPGDWDCSSFVSYVLGHDFGLALPGGGTYGAAGYPPNAHGPVVAAYASWKGATTLGRNEAPRAGDLVLWLPDSHIGIMISATEMISALDTDLGTISSGTDGAADGTRVYRRLNGTGPAPTGDGGTGATASATASAASALAALGAGAGIAGALVLVAFAAAAGIGIVGALLISAAISKAGGQ